MRRWTTTVTICLALSLPSIPAFVLHSPVAPSSGTACRTHFQSFLTTTIASSNDGSSSSQSQAEQEQPEPPDQLTVPEMADLVDTTFVQACLQLGESGNIDVLKLLIAAVQAAYVQSVPLTDLVAAVDAVAVPAAGRPLAPEEVQIRNVWMELIYVMLTALQYNNNDHAAAANNNEPTYDYSKHYATPICTILMRRRQLMSSNKNDFDAKALWQSTQSLWLDNDNDTTNSLQQISDNPAVIQALAQQCLRVLWVTMLVVDDVELCRGEFAKMDQARPPIPGAF